MKNKNFYTTDYYSNSYVFSNFNRYWYSVTIGSRGRGKTFSAKKYILKKFRYRNMMHWSKKFDNGKQFKFAWLRLTDSAIEKMLENNGSTFFERELLDKYHIEVNIVGSDVFFAKSEDYLLVDDKKVYEWVHVGKVMSIQSYAFWKGNQFTDYDIIIMDELVRAETERRTFNISRAFINMIENLARKRTDMRCVIFANAINEMQEIKELFGFMPFPGKFGVYKLPQKKTLIEYLDDTAEWKKEQSQTMAGILAKSSEFTNVFKSGMEDKDTWFVKRSDITNKTYVMSIKINKDPFWYDIHSIGSVYFIDFYKYTDGNKTKTNAYCLDPELVTQAFIFSKEAKKFIKAVWDNGQFRFSSLTMYNDFKDALLKYNII